MRLVIDTTEKTLQANGRDTPLYSDEAFKVISDIWLKVGWNQKYSYTMSWLGVPIIQLPEDLVRYQEAVYRIKPDVIIETGIAHGGSAILSASLCKLMGRGRVIAVDVEIRPHNQQRLENHMLSPLITLIEGSSTAPEVIAKIKSAITPGETVLVVLDSDHSYAHVMAELELYAPLVTPGSYIVATDGIMRDLTDVPRGHADWAKDNPAQAAVDFCAKYSNYTIAEPAWPFNESTLEENITHWPMAWIQRTF